MKVLVTGSEGKIGKLVVGLVGQDCEVVKYDKVLGMDLADVPTLARQMAGCHAVVHLAAIPGPYASAFEAYFRENVSNTLTVARTCVVSGVQRLIYASSTSYYGYERSIRGLPIGDESSPSVVQIVKEGKTYQEFELAYGLSKVMAEALLAFFGSLRKLQVVILRFAPVDWVFDGGVSGHKAAEAVRLALSHQGPLWYEVFNIANKGEISIEKARKILGFVP